MKAEAIPYDIKNLNPFHELDTRVLNWINEIRANYDAAPIMQLPKGRPGCPEHCVIANAFDDIGIFWANYGGLIKDVGTFNAHLVCTWPAYVKAFICQFDNGMRPDLEIHP